MFSFIVRTTNAGATGLAFEGTAFAGSLTQASGGTNNALCISAKNELIEDTTGACVVSSRKFKNDIKTLDLSGIETVLELRPVSFSLNDNVSFDFQDIQYGFIAEEVAEVNPHLAKYGIDGKPRTLDDWAILSTTVKAIQDLWSEFQKIIARVSGLEKQLNNQQKQINELRTEIERLK